MVEYFPANHEVIDNVSYSTAEINRLESTFEPRTDLGAISINLALRLGVGSVEDAQRNQDAIMELDSNDTLRETITAGLDEMAQSEHVALAFMDRRQTANTLKRMRRYSKSYLELTRALDQGSEEAPESELLKSLVSSALAYHNSDAGKLTRERLFYTPMGLRAKSDSHLWSPRVAVRLGLSGRFATAFAAQMYASKSGMVDPETLLVPAMMTGMWGAVMSMPIAGEYGGMAKDGFVYPILYNPLKKKLDNSEHLPGAMLSAGWLDLLTSTVDWKNKVEANGHKTVFPKIETSDEYHFSAKDLKNPLLAARSEGPLTANDLEISNKQPLTFLTGPNSGGKSTISKALVQNQILGQIGAPVVASEASMTVADRIAYHVPTPPDLNDETGRFGYELGMVRKIVDRSTEKSLAVLDDCLDGTTHEERLIVLDRVMRVFAASCGATMFSTHAHELVESFEKRNDGQFLQVEFQDRKPSYRLIPGVSHDSHADRVAQLYGFGEDQVNELLAQKSRI